VSWSLLSPPADSLACRIEARADGAAPASFAMTAEPGVAAGRARPALKRDAAMAGPGTSRRNQPAWRDLKIAGLILAELATRGATHRDQPRRSERAYGSWFQVISATPRPGSGWILGGG